MAKAQPTYTEPWIDYSDSQDAPPDNGLYHLALFENRQYVFEADECAPRFLFESRL